MNSLTVQQCIEAQIKESYPEEKFPQASAFLLRQYQWRTEVSEAMQRETLQAFSAAEAYKARNPNVPEPEAELEAMQGFLTEFRERLRSQVDLLPQAA